MATTATDSNKTVEQFEQFFRNYYDAEVKELANRYPNDQRSLYVDWNDLFRFDPDLADDYVNQPEQLRRYAEEALRLYDLPVDVSLGQAHVRVYNLGETRDVDEVSRSQHVNSLLDVKGRVSKTSDVKPKIQEAAFECQRCGTLSRIPQSGNDFQEPHECQGCERQGPFDINFDQSEFTDHQYARIQEPPSETQGGQGTSIDVHLQDDLTEECHAGDRVTVTSILRLEQQGSQQDKSAVFDTRLDATAVQTEESDFEDIEQEEYLDEVKAIANGERGDPFELLIDSVNPKHQGDEDVKLAIALQLFGGWGHEYPDGSRDRGDIHVLLLGDPGCGKSTFLRWVDSIAPRSTFASGKGASAAGMTAAAVSDDFGETEWSLEAGALVLASGGVACVDEIDKVSDDAVSSMHDALEGQQVVHVNKAGINAHLQTRSALLAAGNPKDGRFNDYQSIGEQIDLAPALFSRFDFTFMVSDSPDEQTDRDVVRHMLRSRRASGRYTKGEDLSDEDRDRIEPAIDREVLRAYIAYARENCNPILKDQEVEQAIADFFWNFRQEAESNDDAPIPITYRSVEGIQRLAEASARVRLSDEVTMEDVKRATDLVQLSMKQVGYDPETGEFDADVKETGSSKRERDSRQELIDLIAYLVEETGNGVDAEQIHTEAETGDWDIKPDRVDHLIGKCKNKGLIYELKDGDIRVT